MRKVRRGPVRPATPDTVTPNDVTSETLAAALAELNDEPTETPVDPMEEFADPEPAATEEERPLGCWSCDCWQFTHYVSAPDGTPIGVGNCQFLPPQYRVVSNSDQFPMTAEGTRCWQWQKRGTFDARHR